MKLNWKSDWGCIFGSGIGSLVAALAIAPSSLALSLQPLGTYTYDGAEKEGAAEISTYDPRSKTLYVTNAIDNSVDLLDLSNPRRPRKISSIDLYAYGGSVNSVAFSNGILAVAVEAYSKQDDGTVVFFDNRGDVISAVGVGALPDMVAFTPNGKKLLVANEGEPNDSYSNDPVGSISIVNLSNGVEQATVKTVGFREGMLSGPVRVFGKGASVAQDLEPEYIAVAPDGQRAFVSLQENNAIAILNLTTDTISRVVGLGFKDYSSTRNLMDASDKDDQSGNFQAWPVWGMYQPDAIASYQANGQTYVVTANEGDAREYEAEGGGYVEETRVGKLTLDATAFPNAETLQAQDQLGRLKTTTALGDTDGDGDHDEIYSYGARSFSIFDANGRLVFDSGNDFETTLARQYPDSFVDKRSDDKGPEPEGITLGRFGGRTFAFVGLERSGGIMTYDITNPRSPNFVGYTPSASGDESPEGLLVIKAVDSPLAKPLLVVTNEVSGTTTIYEIADLPAPPTTSGPVRGLW